MDQKCINSIIKCLIQSDMSDLNFRKVTIRPIRYKIGEEGLEEKVFISDTLAFDKFQISDAWVVGNILIFTVFDGYLENKYHLTEGETFRKHYECLPESTSIEKITKNCYRIMKIIRNAIQHNISNVKYDSGKYDIEYYYKNTLYRLQISSNGISCLYTIIMNIVQEQIREIGKKYTTAGHYEGIIYSLYTEMNSEIVRLSDDIDGELLTIPDGLKLRMNVRYLIENPQIVMENENTITFFHVENNFTTDESDSQYCYSQDYIYKNYILPQEIGKIVLEEEKTFDKRTKGQKICFYKKSLEDKWKIHPAIPFS